MDQEQGAGLMQPPYVMSQPVSPGMSYSTNPFQTNLQFRNDANHTIDGHDINRLLSEGNVNVSGLLNQNDGGQYYENIHD